KTFLDHWLLDADLSAYLELARLPRLNAVERALLAWRLTADAALPRLFADEVATQPPDPARDARLIDALLGGATLDGHDDITEAQADAVAAAAPAMTTSLAQRDVVTLDSVTPRGRPAMRDDDDAHDRDGDDLRRDVAGREHAAPMFRSPDL